MLDAVLPLLDQLFSVFIISAGSRKKLNILATFSVLRCQYS